MPLGNCGTSFLLTGGHTLISGIHTTKVFSKVLADERNSDIVLSFSSSFGRPNNLVKHLPKHLFVSGHAETYDLSYRPLKRFLHSLYLLSEREEGYRAGFYNR